MRKDTTTDDDAYTRTGTRRAVPSRARTLWTACAAHALHDGYTDLIYLLLPIWQAEFAIGYGALAFLRGLAAASMAGLQVPMGRVAEQIGGRTTLALGTALAAIGYVVAGYSTGLVGLCVALVVVGCGFSTQHPIASAAVSRAYQGDARGPLGTYNFAGDIGKAAIPSGASLLLALMSWHHMLWAIAALGLVVAVAVAICPAGEPATDNRDAKGDASRVRRARRVRAAAGRRHARFQRPHGISDFPAVPAARSRAPRSRRSARRWRWCSSAARPESSRAAGWARLGVLATVLLTEAGTAVAILAVLVLPLAGTLVLLPILGRLLNGTSSVLYGTVPELAPSGRTEKAFAIFYTGTIGASATAPILFGILGDAVGSHAAISRRRSRPPSSCRSRLPWRRGFRLASS